MRYFLLLIWGMIVWQLSGQNCANATTDPIRYLLEYQGVEQEIYKYFLPCGQMDDLTIEFPGDFYHPGPDPGTDPTIFIFLMKEIPESEVTPEDFISMLYQTDAGDPIVLTRNDPVISADELISIRAEIGSFYLLPVLVNNRKGSTVEEFFQSSCVPYFSDEALHILESPKELWEFSRFDEIRFTHWPEDTSILEFLDIEIKDAETDEEVVFTQKDNRTLKLLLPRESGIMNLYVYWKDHGCSDMIMNQPWEFPEPGVFVDSVGGFENIKKCVPVRAVDFQSVSGFTIPFHWHSDSLEFLGLSNIHPQLASFLQEVEMEDDGEFSRMKVVMQPDTDTLDLADSTILFEWCGRPLTPAGTQVYISPGMDGAEDEFEIQIYGFSVEYWHKQGQIAVQEDREINYDLVQLCTTRDGKNRLLITLGEDDNAYPYLVSLHSEKGRLDTVMQEDSLLIPHLPAAEYEFTIRDSFGFEKSEKWEMLEFVSSDIEISVSEEDSRHPDCLRPEGGKISVEVSPDGRYLLDLPGYPEHHFEGDSVTGLAHGVYVLRAEDENGCIDTVSYRLEPPAEIEAGWDAAELVFCPGTNEVPFVLEDLSAEPDHTLEYQMENEEVMRPGDTLPLSSPGRYEIFLWNDEGCSLDTSVVVVEAPAELVVFDTTVIEVQSGEEVMVRTGDKAKEGEVKWIFGETLVGQESDVRFLPENSGELIFQARLYDRCLYEDSTWVEVIHVSSRVAEDAFPNAFSPNGDGENDYFKLTPAGEISDILQVQIYDRYGNFIYKEDYQEDSETPGWDGTVGQQMAPPGIYAVVVDYVRRNGRRSQAMFDLLLLR